MFTESKGLNGKPGHRTFRYFLEWKTTILLTIATVAGAIAVSSIQKTSASPTLVFAISMAALAPSGSLLRHCIRHLVNFSQTRIKDLYRAHMVAGAMDCLLRTAPELIFSIVALAYGKITVAQTAVVGATLANNLLILGLCLLVATWEKDLDKLPVVLILTNFRLLLIALGSLVMVATFVSFSEGDATSLPKLSRVAAVVLLMLYLCYWWFFFGTHEDGSPSGQVGHAILVSSSVGQAPLAPETVNVSISRRLAQTRRHRAIGRHSKLHPGAALAIGLLTSALSIWLTVVAMRNIHALTEGDEIPKTFVELVILPLATTTVDGIIALLHARRQDMDWTMQATIQSTIGIVLFVMPATICVGWAMGADSMTLQFNGFQVVSVFLTILVLTSVFQDPSGRWVEGAMLVGFYVLLVTASWF